MKKKFTILSLILSSMLIFISCSGYNGKVAEIEKPEKLPMAIIKIKGYGELKVDLYPHKAPNTVNNFIELANNKFYDGLTIHRVVRDFVLQGGCPNGDGAGDPGYSIKGEFKANGFNINDIKHEKGVLSMARGLENDSVGSQFFIMLDDNNTLDGNYSAFGKLVSGMEVLDKINKIQILDETDKNAKTMGRDIPKDKIYIESIRIEMNGNKVGKVEKI